MAQSFRLRRGTAAQWTAANPVLAQGEPGYETDTGKLGIGDGVTAWGSLPKHLDSSKLVGKGSMVVNVKDHGAVGDGVVDDAAAIQAAINTLNTTGGIVYVPVGDYRIATTLELPSNVTLQGTGRKSRIFTTTNKLNLIVSLNTVNVVVRDLYVEGNGTGSQPANVTPPTVASLANSGCGVTFMGVTNGLMERVRVYNCAGDGQTADTNGIAGLYLTYGCIDCTVRDCYVDTCRNGINEDNYFSGQPNGNKIVNNTVVSCLYGIATDSGGRVNILIDGNTVRNCLQSGIESNRSGGVKITHNHVEGNGTLLGNSGIVVYASSTTDARNILISGNTCIGNGKPGTGGHGMKVADWLWFVTITDNICRDNVKYGIFVQRAVRYWRISGNECIANGEAGLRADVGSEGTIANGQINDNIVQGNGHHGIWCSGVVESTVANNISKGNGTALANTYDGIHLSGSTRNTIIGNIVRGATHRHAIRGELTTHSNTLLGNDVAEAATSNISFASGDTNTLTVPQVLARTSYAPGTAVFPSTTSTAFVDVDATNLAVTFTAPPFGAVDVILSAMCDMQTSGHIGSWNLRAGAADVAGTARAVTRSNESLTLQTTIRVTGLTPGTSYTYKWGYKTNNAAGYHRILSGGEYGTSVMEVRAA